MQEIYDVLRPKHVVLHTLLRAGEDFMPSTTSAASGPWNVPLRPLGACVALTSTLDRLVNDLGGRLRFPVRVELWVVA